MTTYTITEAQRQQLLASYDTSQSLSHDLLDHLTRIDGCWDLLQSLEPVAAQKPVAWYEYSPSTNAWFLAYSDNPRAKTRPLVFGDTAAPAPQPARILTDAERAEREKARDK